MKVKEIIEMLLTLDQEKEVEVEAECGYVVYDDIGVYEKDGKIRFYEIY